MNARADTDRNIRALDVFGAGVGLFLLSPILLTLAAIVRLTSPGPAFFRTLRVGRNGRLFTLLKFRSMVEGARAAGPAITVAGDRRVTRVGGILRRWKLDELPQLINVLRGEMSLVGPRPEDPTYVAVYSRLQLEILEARPGMTSPASLHYRDEERQLAGEDWEDRYLCNTMPAKLAMDREYVRDRTVWSDVRVILATLAAVAGFRRLTP